jgi:perosamine synthetase
MMKRLIAQLWGTTTPGDCLAALRTIVTSRHLVQGPAITEFEEAFAREVGVRHAISFASGRVALYALLRSYDLQSGDEVLLQVPTHIVVPNAIRFAGGKPVFVDCRFENYNMDLVDAESKITPKTRALLVQHTYGIPVDMDAAQELAEKYDLLLIEDCVHALGATYQGKPVGSIGDSAFFSTEETKVISSTMGGMAVTDDPEIAARLRRVQEQCSWPEQSTVARYLAKFIVYFLFTHPLFHRVTHPIYMALRRNPRTHLAPGATSASETHGQRPGDYLQRLTNGQAILALRQLSRLEKNLAHRRRIAARLQETFNNQGFHLPTIPKGVDPSFVRFPLTVSDRPAAMQSARKRVLLGQWFNSVLEESASPEFGGYQSGSCPRAELLAEHLVNLPTHFRFTENDIDPILELLREYAWKPE